MHTREYSSQNNADCVHHHLHNATHPTTRTPRLTTAANTANAGACGTAFATPPPSPRHAPHARADHGRAQPRTTQVRAGEHLWVFPNQNNADYVANSALEYEGCVLKVLLEPLLRAVPPTDPTVIPPPPPLCGYTYHHSLQQPPPQRSY